MTPTVTITPPLDVIEKNNTRDVSVTVTNNASGSTTFSLRTIAGTGSATFADGSTSITVNGNVTNQTLTIKGVTESSRLDNITIEAKFNNSSTVSAHDEFTVATITSLVFQKFGDDYDDITDNPGNGQPNTNVGQRISPDKKTPGDTTDRALIKVNATVSPAVPNLKVYFGSYDLDDPSADTAPLDSSSDGNDNNGSVNGSKSGDFTILAGNTCVNPSTGAFINYISTIECPTLSDGTATAQYKITM